MSCNTTEPISPSSPWRNSRGATQLEPKAHKFSPREFYHGLLGALLGAKWHPKGARNPDRGTSPASSKDR